MCTISGSEVRRRGPVIIGLEKLATIGDEKNLFIFPPPSHYFSSFVEEC